MVQLHRLVSGPVLVKTLYLRTSVPAQIGVALPAGR